MTSKKGMWGPMEQNLREFLSPCENYLPGPLKDFHDQKAIFKRVDEMVQADIATGPEAMMAYEGYNWRLGHVFTIDKFLWFMAAHGYVLQKSKKKGVKFLDIGVTMDDFNERQAQIFNQWLKAASAKPEEQNPQKSEAPT